MKKKEIINTKEVLCKLFPDTMEREIGKNEQICPVCQGIGLVQMDGRLFFCSNCNNGVQSLCPYCKKPLNEKRCDCEKWKKQEEEEKYAERRQRIESAIEVNENDVDTMLYCEENDKYFYSVDDFFEEFFDAEQCGFLNMSRPEVLWVCGVEDIYIDADNIVESACENLHDDAADSCDKDSLQILLDDWCKEQTGTTTCYPTWKEYVRIDWNKY